MSLYTAIRTYLAESCVKVAQEIIFIDFEIEDNLVSYVVIVAIKEGKLLLCRHRDRTTWELPAGHRESEETPFEAAKRELIEETGAIKFVLSKVSSYAVKSYENEGLSPVYDYGVLFSALVEEQGSLKHEIAETSLFDALPARATYPEIQTVLISKALTPLREK